MRKVRPDNRFLGFHRRLPPVLDWLVDLIFPPTCGGCHRVDFRWCDVCLDHLQKIPVAFENRPQRGMAGVCATGLHDGMLKRAVQAFKYHGAIELAEPLAKRLVTILERQKWELDIIIPVPLSAARLAERGYNQANLLSQQVARHMGIPCQPDCLQRTRDTSQQTLLNARQRVENVKDAFSAAGDVANRSILLIDDVVTTGSTLNACADALRSAGVAAVYAIAVVTPDNILI